MLVMNIFKTCDNVRYKFNLLSLKDILSRYPSDKDKIEIAKKICNTSGVFMLMVDNETALKLFKEGLYNDPKDLFIGPNVFAFKEFLEGFSEFEVQAIRCHEEGHIFHRHYLIKSNAPILTTIGGITVTSNILNEIEADKYSRKLTGSWNLISAMHKNFKNTLKMYRFIRLELMKQKVSDKHFEDVFNKVIFNGDMRKRLDILSH